MDSNSEDETHKNPNNANEGSGSKPKRQMKTPFQLETLRKAYASETYPSEATRAKLSEKLGLSDRQLQMWFCHRRLKDKKDNHNPSKATVTVIAAPLPESPLDEMRAGSDYGSGSRSGSGSGSEDSSPLERRKGSLDEVPMRHYESPQSIMELRAIACIEAQLGEPLREDGPVLGMEFDPLLPDAFGEHIANVEQQKRYESKIYDRLDAKSNKVLSRGLHQDNSSFRPDTYGKATQSHLHNFPIEGPGGRNSLVRVNKALSRTRGVKGHASRVHMQPHQEKAGHNIPSSYGDDDPMPPGETSTSNEVNIQSSGHLNLGQEHTYSLADGQAFNDNAALQMEQKRKVDEDRLAREVEAQENRLRKELERHDIQRQKNEERLKKQMEKLDRERRKEEERLMHERLREEERSQREQKREIERKEKYLQKESIRVERMKQKEELRREREAARRKVALEKATARKIAKESMDLIDDEQLELMELAAANKRLPSIIHLDYDTLQNLESFRESLIEFPPKSLALKQPFAVQPWADSEENVGNLLMVWCFLITFADVLGLWPFTLDEFVQAFHDYDSRLLVEIHVALLKLIIKDIEDVARTPTIPGNNQHCAANPEGGHPEIVEGAYAWGFDIRNWQQHLNQLTWPEVFRQLALSAGFGPQLKKNNVGWTYLGNNNEGKGCEDVVSTLRNGSAAENAFASMREKGLLLPRRSRHRLTPGTVKFAAFHVLSLEGAKGLNVIVLADKIQKSGLRDLTSSKTPEASISVALTRDTKLFERIAPSTYCVRATYRKDPADAEAILAEARKKIQMFENGFTVVDDVERDDDLVGDVDEDPEVDDLATPLNARKNVNGHTVANACRGSGKDYICSYVTPVAENEFDKDFSYFPANDSGVVNGPSTTEQYNRGADVGRNNLNQETIEIDESKSCESWIQGLSEGEYSHLSVEERLNALATLIGVANEGNSVRAVLEVRLEAANALKKQILAEAQVHKICLREENIGKLNFLSTMGCKTEDQFCGTGVEDSQSSLPFAVDNKITEASPDVVEEQKSLSVSQFANNHVINCPAEDNFLTQQPGYASKRYRSQLKSYITHRAEELYTYRSLPLGQDRRRNRYLQFVASASRNDPCSGRIFVELYDGKWRLIDSEEAFDTLVKLLDTRGIRESHLRIMLQKSETSFKENLRRNFQCEKGRSDSKVINETPEMDSSPKSDSSSSVVRGLNFDTADISSSFQIELGRNEMEQKAALRRYQDFQMWMWRECFNLKLLSAVKYGNKRSAQILNICDSCFNLFLSEDTHCRSCQHAFDIASSITSFSDNGLHYEDKKMDLDDDNSSLPLAMKLLKTLFAFIEASVPLEALESSWVESCRKTWGQKLNMSSSPDELLKILTRLESAIKRNYLSLNFETTKELLGYSGSVHDSSDIDSVSVLPWIPHTTAAVALKILELDASIMYSHQEKAEPCEDMGVEQCTRLPISYYPLKNKENEEDHDAHIRGVKYTDSGSRPRSGRGGRDTRSYKRKRRAPYARISNGRRTTKDNESLGFQLRQQGRRTNGQSSGRGRRTVIRSSLERRTPLLGGMADIVRPNINGETPRKLNEDWHNNENTMQMEATDNGNDAEEEESDENPGETGYGQRNWQIGFNGPSYNGWNQDLMDMSDEEVAEGIQEIGDDFEDLSGESDVPNDFIGNDHGVVESDVSDDYSD